MCFNFSALINKVNHLIKSEFISVLIIKAEVTHNGTCSWNHVNWDTGLCS